MRAHSAQGRSLRVSACNAMQSNLPTLHHTARQAANKGVLAAPVETDHERMGRRRGFLLLLAERRARQYHLSLSDDLSFPLCGACESLITPKPPCGTSPRMGVAASPVSPSAAPAGAARSNSRGIP